MGLCGSKNNIPPEEIKTDKTISKQQQQALEVDKKVTKLLLLGAGASGKSTLFKQINSIYGKGMNEQERKLYEGIIHQNILNGMKTLVEHSDKYSDNRKISPEITESKLHQSVLQEYKEIPLINVELGHHIALLWQDPVIQIAFNHADEFHVNECCKYFFDNIDRITGFNYVPTEQDVLRARAPTTGIVENKFIIEGNKFSMMDVGGQRNERKKWIHCFENVTAVLFVTALSEYNQTLFEDATQNRLTESLILFEEICTTKYLSKVSMVLFLNKSDLFSEKLPQYPLAHYFPEFTGDNNDQEAAAWIKSKFKQRNPNPERKIYTHITCATDKNNIKVVFEAVKDIVLKKNIQDVFHVQ